MSANAAMIDGLEDAALLPCNCGPYGSCPRGCQNRKRPKAKRAKAPVASETGTQIAIINRMIFHGIVCVHVKNERKQSVQAGRAMKAAGVLPGMPDLVAMQSPGRVAFLEVKKPGWKPPGPDANGEGAEHWRRQVRVHDMLRRLGHFVAVVRSQDEAAAALKEAGFRL